MKNKLLCCALFAVGLPILSACEKGEQLKEEPVKQEVVSNANEVSIDTLKAFIYEIGNVPIDQIVYDSKTEKFFFLGVEQYTREQLTKDYFNYQKVKQK
ncbi:hypothetical protein [Pedobacter nanyangensis]|uniref:hypothetical protein n=1 Tax=Pedobacter nanyangensis TaxID=1562389 RepID=UPI000DE45076|nr:hypothetical protein [Pedobacter nanyangensis]